MRKMTHLFVASLCVAALSSCASQRKQVVYEEQGPFEVFTTQNTEVTPYRIPAITKTSKGHLLAVADSRPCRADIGYGRVDLHGRISEDNGKTWGDVFTIIEGDGVMVDKDPNQSLTAGYGDPCLIADRESDRVLLMCVAGHQVFFRSTREVPNQVAIMHSEDGGKTWGKPSIITDQFYVPLDESVVGPIQSMFIGSGRIMQSTRTKVGDYYRLYACMLARDKDNNFCNFVVYSDDFGYNWKILGDINVPGVPKNGDEPKTEELPDGSIILSSRTSEGRMYNIFKFTNAEKAEGSWGEYTFSGKDNNGVVAERNSCNGEIMILPVYRNSDNKKMHLALQSVPFGPQRTNVGIYYKELADASDYATPADFAKDWDGRFQVSEKGSAYSTMVLQADGQVAFFFEEDTYEAVGGGGYTMVYKSLPIDKITEGKYSLIH